MNKIKTTIKKDKKSSWVLLAVLVIVCFFLFKNGEKSTETYIVGKTNVTQSVVLSGQVLASDRADLGFAATGRLAKIYVKNNQEVESGQILAQLEIGDLLADLKIKEANSRISDVDLSSAKEELEKVTAQEDTKVASAYRTLLTEGLEPIPQSNTYTAETPTISGIYDGSEGQYKISISKENVTSSDFTIRTFNLEKTENIINEDGPTKLGTHGLYITFPDSLTLYNNTTWYLDIPNKASSSYLDNFNAYNEAKNTRDLAIKNAESAYQKLLVGDNDGSSVAQAEIQKINAEVRKNTIYAPFKGKVTNIEKELGENASVGERVVSMVGEEKLEVVLQVSELDVSRIIPGSEIKIFIDAFPGETFSGLLTTINSRETEIDGVPVYEAFVELQPDNRVKNGMNAKGTIILAENKDVLAIPVYLITKEGEKNFVEIVVAGGKTEKREITTGLLGTDSMVEIVSGLVDGDRVVSKSVQK